MHDSLIAWMMSGGNRFETPAERINRENARAFREARADTPAPAALRSAIAPVRARAMSVLGLASATMAAPTTTPDCCPA